MGRATARGAGPCRAVPSAQLPPRRVRRQQPRRGAGDDGGSCRALPAAHESARDRAGAHRRSLVERRDRPAARPRRAGRGPYPGRDGRGPAGSDHRATGGIPPRFRRARTGALSRGGHGRRSGHVLLRRFRALLPRPARARTSRRLRSSGLRCGRVLHPGVARALAVLVVRGRFAQPVLVVVGENSAATFPERRELLLSWLPNVESFELPGATHLLHVQNPRGMAEALASFFARHPLPPVPRRRSPGEA